MRIVLYMSGERRSHLLCSPHRLKQKIDTARSILAQLPAAVWEKSSRGEMKTGIERATEIEPTLSSTV